MVVRNGRDEVGVENGSKRQRTEETSRTRLGESECWAKVNGEDRVVRWVA